MQNLNSITTTDFLLWYLCGTAIFSYLMFKISGFKSFWSFILLFLFNTVMIIVGPVLTLLLYFYLSKANKNISKQKVHTLDMNLLKISYPLITRDYRGGPLEDFLINEESSQERKVRILSYIKENFHKDDMRLFYSTLSGRGDESRLFCFGTINQMEKKLNDKINDLFDKLSKCTDTLKKSAYESELAHLYWDFVYFQLISKDLEGFYLDNAKNFTQKALKTDPEDRQLNILLAKINLKMKRFDQAAEAFEKVIDDPSFRDTALPYMAQLYFEKRDFEQLRHILDKVKTINYVPKVLSFTSLWRDKLCLIETKI